MTNLGSSDGQAETIPLTGDLTRLVADRPAAGGYRGRGVRRKVCRHSGLAGSKGAAIIIGAGHGL